MVYYVIIKSVEAAIPLAVSNIFDNAPHAKV